ncbi:MAG: hypothetical protein ACREIA_07995 [Opitutaceae bacterium]
MNPSPKTRPFTVSALAALGIAVGVWVAKMLVGVILLARHQDVPVLTAVFEMAMFLGAGLIPLAAVWLVEDERRRWLYVLWAPCILYVSFLAVRYCLASPFAGAMRLLLWAAIIVLFIRVSLKTKPA